MGVVVSRGTSYRDCDSISRGNAVLRPIQCYELLTQYSHFQQYLQEFKDQHEASLQFQQDLEARTKVTYVNQPSEQMGHDTPRVLATRQ
jgi:hypothetical protein